MRLMRWALPGLVAAVCLVAAAVASAAPYLYVTVNTTNQLFTFDAAGGRLAALRPTAVSTGRAPEGVAVTPDGENVYVADALDGTISQYGVDPVTGTLNPLTPATIRTGKEPIGIAVNPDGRSVYVTNLGDSTLSQYDIGPGGALSSTIPATVTTGFDPFGVAVSPNGHSVYVANCGDATVSEYDVGTGDTLTPKRFPTVKAGPCPNGIAVSPNGQNVYVTNLQNATVSRYTVLGGGLLASLPPATVATGQFPGGIAVSPDSQSVYVADENDGTIAQYAVTGQGLRLKTPETIGAGTEPVGLVVSPSGSNMYAIDADGTVLQYGGGDGPGTLSPLSPATVPTQAVAVGIAIGSPHIQFGCVDVINACNVQLLPIEGGGTTNALLIKTTPVQVAQFGILVQRLVRGRHVLVGHVPFGLRRPGHLRIRWNLRVNGHRLRKGRYLITLRMFDRRGYPVARAHPILFTIK
jgi:DNA-binding beta-propeller fold protein YncE